MNRNSFKLILGGVALLGIADAATAADINVPADQPTIQDAINAAVNGDSIIISPGTYFENINYNGKDVIVRSLDRDPTTVTIDGGGAVDHVVHIDGVVGTGAKLIGVTVTGGDAGSGGGIRVDDGKAQIRRCIVTGNTANTGAGIRAEGSVEISQCLVYDNVSNAGGAGMYLSAGDNAGGTPEVINCVVAANESIIGQTAGIFVFDADAQIRNTIIGSNDGLELFTTAGTIDAQYSLIEGGFAGTGNLDVSPQFVSLGSRDFRLSAGSPCIDAGDSNALPGSIQEDIAGNGRYMHDPNTPNTGIGVPTVDMGAYEYIPRVRYVDVDATGAGTGMTWDDAYTDFVDAINAVTASPDADEIWVANGTYKADQGTSNRSMSFNMRSNQTWYGGFAGGELFADERDWLTNQVILGGAIGAPGDADDTYHIVRAVSVTNSVIDGFILQEGNADNGDGGGGGMWILKNAEPQVNRLWIRQNEAVDGPGGVYIENSSPTFEGVRINRNTGDLGGGVHMVNSDVTFSSSVIAGNETTFAGAGGMFTQDSALNVLNCTVYSNFGNPGIATHGIQANDTATKIYNSIFWDNQGNEFFPFGGVYLVRNTTLEGSSQSGFGSASNNGTDPQFVDLDGANNVVGDADDDFQLSSESNCIDSADESLGVLSTVDILGNVRMIDDNGMPNTGVGKTDRGAVEFQGTSCAYDCDDDGTVGITDLLFTLGAWGNTNGNPLCEYVGEPGGDGFIDVLELLGLLGAWGDCP